MREYLDAVEEVLRKGTRKPNRTGVDTISTFNINYEIDLDDGFPLLTTKRVSWKNIVVELLWFLSGDVSIDLLRKHNCKFWDPWADDDGRVPSAYGNFWRNFPIHDEDGEATYADQVQWVIDEIKRNPMSRRLVISAWAPGNAHHSALPPCHCLFIFNVQHDDNGQQRLNLHLTQRSCDIALGVPYNIASYSLLLTLIGQFVGIRPGIFAHTLVDAHIYTAKADGTMSEFDHVPGLHEQLDREPLVRPTLRVDSALTSLDDLRPLLDKDTRELMSHFELLGYAPHEEIRFKVAV